MTSFNASCKARPTITEAIPSPVTNELIFTPFICNIIIINNITKIYGDFVENEYSKIYEKEFFGYRKVTVLQPEINIDGTHQRVVINKLKAYKDSVK